MKTRRMSTMIACVLSLCGLALSAGAARADDDDDDRDDDAEAARAEVMRLPTSLTLTGVARDFRERTAQGGHPDFERGWAGIGVFANMVQVNLDSEKKPVFASRGFRVTRHWTDAQGRRMMPMLSGRDHIASMPGDVRGEVSATAGNQVHSAESFSQWFRDVPGLNMSQSLSLTLRRDADSAVFVYDDRVDETMRTRSGFFPLNGQLLGNSGGGGIANTNYHFTLELPTKFTYRAGRGDVFTFRGDDDVWVFVDGKLVIDLGGIHSVEEQTVHMDRLTWLRDGQTYDLRFFFAERQRVASNFRMSTTLRLRSIEMPKVTGAHD